MAKRYDKEFKLHAVKQVVEQGKTAAQVARELEKQLRDLKEENEILKKAMGIFVKDLK